jgi:proteasome beta subunit
MTLPRFSPNEDPGPSFSALLRKLDLAPPPLLAPPSTAGAVPITHGTTIVALRYADGVVMAGDRRATSGNVIAQRDVEKVHAADRFSGVAISGAAGFGLEMIKVFQLELEHYEKSSGNVLSLEGKANMLAGMVRNNLPMAMQGFIVVPLFAGYDTRRRRGRIFSYDPTGGRNEEKDFDATGSGGRDARTTIKLGWTDGMERDAAIELAVQCLYEAADEDSATGGPDAVRGFYQSVATISASVYVVVVETEVAERFAALIARKTEQGLHR